MTDNEITIKMVDNGFIIYGRFRCTKLPEYVEHTEQKLQNRIQLILVDFEKREKMAIKYQKEFDRKYGK